MKLTLVRDIVTPKFTLGVLYVDGKFFAYTCEDPVREVKVKKETCIWYGHYDVIHTWSPHFGFFVPEIKNVRQFVGVRIHPGNNVKHTEGCVLVGLHRDVVAGTISDSKVACDWLYKQIALNDTTLDIVKETPEGFEVGP